jgi:hypothetical protein
MPLHHWGGIGAIGLCIGALGLLIEHTSHSLSLVQPIEANSANKETFKAATLNVS